MFLNSALEKRILSEMVLEFFVIWVSDMFVYYVKITNICSIFVQTLLKVCMTVILIVWLIGSTVIEVHQKVRVTSLLQTLEKEEHYFFLNFVLLGFNTLEYKKSIYTGHVRPWRHTKVHVKTFTYQHIMVHVEARRNNNP